MTAPQLEWVEVGREHLRDTTSRFDVFRSAYGGHWVAIDGDFGRKTRCPTVDAAKDWCEQRIAIRRAA